MLLLLSAIPLDAHGEKSILVWSLVLIVLLIVAFGGYSYFKKWMSQDTATTRGGGFTLSDLRTLRDQGKMSNEEYEAARAKMVAAAKRMTTGIQPVLPRKVPTAKFEERNSAETGNSNGEIRMTNQGRNSKDE